MKLTRRRTERMLFGVCAGFARYLDLDVTLVRVVFVILALAGGVGVLIYVAAALLIPDEREDPMGTDDTQSQEPAAAPRPEDPAAAGKTSAELPPQAAPGPADAEEIHRRRRSTIGIVLVVLGVVLLAGQYVDVWRWAWPLLLIVLGVLLIFRERR